MDFAKLHLDIDEVITAGRWVVALDLVHELQRDTGSHLFASLHDYLFIAPYGALAQAMTATATTRLLAMFSTQGKTPTPFPTPFPTSPAERIDAAEHDAAVRAMEDGIRFAT